QFRSLWLAAAFFSTSAMRRRGSSARSQSHVKVPAEYGRAPRGGVTRFKGSRQGILGSAREMIESGTRELHHTGSRENPDAFSRYETADARHRAEPLGDGLRHRAESRKWDGEQQLVVVAPGECVFASDLAAHRVRERIR